MSKEREYGREEGRVDERRERRKGEEEELRGEESGRDEGMREEAWDHGPEIVPNMMANIV